ncbi:MAG: iron-containing alcohol dehydrogenase [Succinivibrio sp.]|nr:iron-containing alcohol dehydrogenase [Succinivibrio sp.]
MSIFSQGSIRKIVGGENSIEQIVDLAKSFNAKNIVVVTDAGVFATGLVNKPVQLLQDAGFNVSVIKDVPPEPSVEQVNHIYDQAKNVKCDLLVGIGGGSSMDTTKLVSLMLTNSVSLKDMVKGTKPTLKGVPTLMVPTTAGTGSEATPNAIVLVPEENLKVGIVTDLMIADCVILDPVMTKGLPPQITANTGIDALCHLMECYISKKHNPLSDTFALSGIKMVAESIRECYNNGSNLEARSKMLTAACFGGICIASSSTVAIHALSYPLGGRYHLPHGLANAILMPLVMDANKYSCLDRYYEMAKAMGIDVAGKSKETVAELFVKELYALNADLNIKCNLKDKGVTLDVIDELVEGASKVTRLLGNNPKDFSKAEMAEIYRKLIEANQ